jgi:hypothetical protein
VQKWLSGVVVEGDPAEFFCLIYWKKINTSQKGTLLIVMHFYQFDHIKKKVPELRLRRIPPTSSPFSLQATELQDWQRSNICNERLFHRPV